MGMLFILLTLMVSAKCQKIDSAHRYFAFFKEQLEVPLSVRHYYFEDFTDILTTFTQMGSEFGYLFAKSIKTGIEDYEMDALKYIVKGALPKVEDIRLQIKHIMSAADLKLLPGYKNSTHLPIASFVTSVAQLLETHTSADVDRFVNQCMHIDDTVQEIVTAVRNCTSATLSRETEFALFNFFNHFKLEKYWLTKKESRQYNALHSKIYFQISSQQDKNASLETIENFVREKKGTQRCSYVITLVEGLIYENKLVLLNDLIVKLGIDEHEPLTKTCIPLEGFIQLGYDRNALLRFADVLLNHAMTITFASTMCANITYYDDADKAGVYVSNVIHELGPIYAEQAEWIDRLINSTWPEKEMELISDLIQEITQGQPVPDETDDYERIVREISEKMKTVGNPRYRRQYVMSKESANDTESFFYDCKRGTCSKATSMGAQLVVFRTRTDTMSLLLDVDKLDHFVKWISPILWDLMDTKFNWQHPSYVVEKLATDYDIDLQSFLNYTGMAIYHKKVYWAKCRFPYALLTDREEVSDFAQIFRYHGDGSTFTDCNDWKIIWSV